MLVVIKKLIGAVMTPRRGPGNGGPPSRCALLSLDISIRTNMKKAGLDSTNHRDRSTSDKSRSRSRSPPKRLTSSSSSSTTSGANSPRASTAERVRSSSRSPIGMSFSRKSASAKRGEDSVSPSARAPIPTSQPQRHAEVAPSRKRKLEEVREVPVRDRKQERGTKFEPLPADCRASILSPPRPRLSSAALELGWKQDGLASRLRVVLSNANHDTPFALIYDTRDHNPIARFSLQDNALPPNIPFIVMGNSPDQLLAFSDVRQFLAGDSVLYTCLQRQAPQTAYFALLLFLIKRTHAWLKSEVPICIISSSPTEMEKTSRRVLTVHPSKLQGFTTPAVFDYLAGMLKP